MIGWLAARAGRLCTTLLKVLLVGGVGGQKYKGKGEGREWQRGDVCFGTSQFGLRRCGWCGGKRRQFGRWRATEEGPGPDRQSQSFAVRGGVRGRNSSTSLPEEVWLRGGGHGSCQVTKICTLVPSKGAVTESVGELPWGESWPLQVMLPLVWEQ